MENHLKEAADVMRGRAITASRAAARGLTVQEYLRERSRTRWARDKAQQLGLAYWPALAYGPRIDPWAYVLAERFLAARTGEAWDPAAGTFGGWDMCGHKGLSPHDVARAWYRAGCRENTQFWVYLTALWEGLPLPNRALSTRQARDWLRGVRWVDKNKIYNRMIIITDPVIIVLGRLPWHCRWAALNGLGEGDTPIRVRIRHLNWAAVKTAQRGWRAAYRAGYLPRAVLWYQLVPELASAGRELGFPELQGVPVATLRALLKEEEQATAADVQAAINLVRLYGRDRAAIRRRIAAWGNLHDAGQVSLPDRPIRAGWGQWLDSHPSCWRWTHLLDAIEEVLGGRLPETAAECAAAAREAIKASPEAALVELGVARESVRRYVKLYRRGPKDHEMIPAPRGVAKDGYALRQLPHDDPIAPAVGLLTDCCQHLDSAASSCAKASWLRGDCAVWVAEKSGEIVAQSFVWRSKSALVLDSIEAKGGYRKGEVAGLLADLFLAAARQAIGRLCIERAFVGETHYGITGVALSRCAGEATRPDEPYYGRIGYTDAHQVREVCHETH
ncbi:MAG: hypothetical protein D6775_14045 [Caldilineae bacterium]|nr:MAG: hypothetical protein D6775_14045 [Caldilineae bacterium]